MDKEFRWERWTGKWYKFDLTQVKAIKPGKQTDNFLKAESDDASVDNSLSLITDNTTFDLEAPNKVDRDSIVILLRKFLNLPLDPGVSENF